MINNIQSALDGLLKDWADSQSITVAWENKGRPTDVGTPYLSSFLLPAETVAVGMADGSSNDFTGIYQVDVNVPAGKGTIDSRPLVDGLLTAFARGIERTVNNQKTRIEMSWRDPAIDGDAWYFVPVSIRYRSFASG